MERPKIFISYSHRDNKALEQFQRFLRPLEREGLIDIWDDTRMQGGDNWKTEIDQALAAATTAVLFISQDFLASEFIDKEELPRILARAATGKLTVLPVFLSPSTVDDRLTRFQGYGTPQKPLSELSWSGREKKYADLSRRIKSLAGKPVTAGRERSPVTRYDPSSEQAMSPSTAMPSREFQLTVHLERRGDALDVHYYLPGTDAIASGTRAWENIEKELEAIGKVLDGNDGKARQRLVEQASTHCGQLFFDLLFGPETEWESVLRRLFDQPAPAPRPNPIRAPVRLRICTDESSLLGLPWRLTAWNRRLLVADRDWEFTTSHVLDPTEDVTTTAPCNVLIVAPQTEVGGVTPDPKHSQAIQDVLKKVWPTGREAGYVRVVQTRGELENALQGMRPHLIYVYGQATVTAGRPALLLDAKRGAEALPLAELTDLCKKLRPRPALIYFNVAGLTGLGPTPVKALHQVNKRELTVEAATLAVHSNYRSWKTQTFRQPALRERLRHLVLDRTHQKALVREYLWDLVHSGSRRVMAMVVYAAPGHLLSSLHEQLRHHLEVTASDLAEINWRMLQFPVIRGNLLRDLEYELKLQLQADSNERILHLLRRHAPTVVGTRKRGVLWLNWGVFGRGSDQQKTLTPSELGMWLHFSSRFLGGNCPEELRIVSYAAIELEDSKHLRLIQVLDDHCTQPWCRSSLFSLNVLPPLGKVPEYDLFKFLQEPANSSCDPGIHAEIARLLIQKTGGNFESIVTLMQEAEDGSWYDLLARLRPEPFLRRCVFHHIEFTEELLRRAVEARRRGDFPDLPEAVREAAIQRFLELRGREIRKPPATAELLVWLTVLAARGDVTEEELRECRLGELPALSTLIKDRDDLAVLR